MIGEIISISERFTQKKDQIKLYGFDKHKILEYEVNQARKNLEIAEEKCKKEKHNQHVIYNEKISKIDEEFKLALFKEYSVENHTKREKMFNIAWERGHSDGYSGVEFEFSILA